MSASTTPPQAGPEERLLVAGVQRLTVYPLAHPELWRHYKQQLASFWTAEEIDFSKDRDQWNTKLNDDERHFVRSILAFFAASDSVVSLNIMNSFCSEVRLLEAQIAYTFQAMMENIHAEVYSMMIDVYVTDPDEREDMFSNLGSLSSVRKKVEWARRWSLLADTPTVPPLAEVAPEVVPEVAPEVVPEVTATAPEVTPEVAAAPEPSATAPFPRRLVAYAIVEGLFFSGAFCAIYWIKQRNLLPGLTKSNEFIARDEGQHTEFACTLYGMLSPSSRLPEAELHALFREAVAVETEFITESVPCRLVGMNAALMTQYIEYVADGLMARLGYATIYGATNPFPFMDLIGMAGRSNFFEERVSLYQRADVLNEDRATAAAAAAAASESSDAAVATPEKKKLDLLFDSDF